MSTRTFLLLLVYIFAGFLLMSFLGMPTVETDIVENIYWGQELQWGYHKHPPLFAWINWAFVEYFGFKNPNATYVLDAISLALTCFFIYKIAGGVLKNNTSVYLSVLLALLTKYLTVKNIEFNANTILIPLWTGCYYFYYQAVRKNHLWYWIMLGVFCGLSLLSKYFSALMILTLLLISCFSPLSRSRLFSAKFFVSLAICLLILAPNLIWLYQNDFISLKYAFSKTHEEGKSGYFPDLIGNVVVCLLGLIAGFMIASKKIFIRLLPSKFDSFTAIFLCGVNLVPFLVCTFVSLCGFRVFHLWCTPFWCTLGVYLIYVNNVYSFYIRRFVIFFVVFVGFLFVYTGLKYRLKSGNEVNLPAKKIALFIEKNWHENFHKPIKYLTFDTKTLASIGVYMQPRPSFLIEGNFEFSPWINKNEMEEYGFVDISCYSTAATYDNNLYKITELEPISTNICSLLVRFVEKKPIVEEKVEPKRKSKRRLKSAGQGSL